MQWIITGGILRIDKSVEAYREETGPYGSPAGFPCGLFLIPFQSYTLRVLVSDGRTDGWEHVSVSLNNRTPNWREMCFVKDLFWFEEEVVVQYHPAKKDYVNFHPNCLHMWRNIEKPIECPPWTLVGPKRSEDL